MFKPMKYKEICEFMGDEVKKGGSGRKSQLEQWQQYYDIEKIGMYYYIKKKYNEDEVKLIESNGKFTTYITDILIDYLSTVNTYKVNLTYYELYEVMCMVNNKYHKAKNNKYDECDKFNVTLSEYAIESGKGKYNEIDVALNDFFAMSSKILKSIIRNSLKSMKNRSLIIYSDSFKLYKKVDGYVTSHICNDDEISKILSYQKEGLKLVGLTTLNQLIYAGFDNYNVYRDYVLKQIKDNLGYDFYSNSIEIILSQDGIKYEADNVNKRRLNGNVQDRILNGKELECITKELNKQFVKEYIEI